MKLCIVIDGKSADELFAVGPNDLREYFLPEYLHVDPKDVKSIHFEEVHEGEDGRPWPISGSCKVHKDNFSRE